MFYISLMTVIFCFVLENEAYRSVSCRNKQFEKVDWWVIYKPPAGAGQGGRNFSYTSSDTLNNYIGSKPMRWQELEDIAEADMLKYTLDPIYKEQDYEVAVLNYEVSEFTKPYSTARGLLITDETKGLYLSHTVPYLVDPAVPEFKFPESEYRNGHMILCITMNISSLNNLGIYVKHTDPKVLSLKVPNSMMTKVPSWFYVQPNSEDTTWANIHATPMKFNTFQDSVPGLLMVRKRDQGHCIYQAFAKHQGVILDVYAPSKQKKNNFCDKNYGVRSIHSISLNIPGENAFVQYVNRHTDKMKFAVTTAAAWQERIPGQEQYWACYSGLERDVDFGQGGLILCLNNYLLWNAMDTLKVKEPKCKKNVREMSSSLSSSSA